MDSIQFENLISKSVQAATDFGSALVMLSEKFSPGGSKTK